MKWIKDLKSRASTKHDSAVSEPPIPGPAMPALELLTVREAALIAKASQATIRRWIRTKKLQAFNSDHRVRINKQELIKFLCKSVHSSPL